MFQGNSKLMRTVQNGKGAERDLQGTAAVEAILQGRFSNGHEK
jgi:hypothetical protein